MKTEAIMTNKGLGIFSFLTFTPILSGLGLSMIFPTHESIIFQFGIMLAGMVGGFMLALLIKTEDSKFANKLIKLKEKQ